MRIWRLLNTLSIDVALGSVASCAYFGEVFSVSLRPHAFISLGLIVWIIYTVDHLLDAARTTFEPSSERHRFHLHHSRPLVYAVLAASSVVAIEAFLVRSAVLFSGVAVAALVIVYLSIQRSLTRFKELAIALLYTTGVAAAPLALLTRELQLNELLILGTFFLTVYVNLMIFSLYGHPTDLADGHQSFATRFGDALTKSLTIALLIAVAALLTLLMLSKASIGFLIPIAAMNLAHVAILSQPGYFSREERYRLLGDAAFLVPALTLLF